MFIPGTIICDFCKGTIDRDLPYPQVELPLSLALRRKVQKSMQDAAQAVVGSELPGLQVVYVPLQAVPQTFKVEVCMGCIEGFFRDVGKVLEEQVVHSVALRQQIMEKRARAGVSPTHDHGDESEE